MAKMAEAGKTVKQILKFTIPAGKAAPQPPVGPRLGQMGVNIMAFCKDFNAATAQYQEGVPLNVTVTAYTDRTADFTTATPPTSFLLKRAAGVEKGAENPGSETVGAVSLKHVYEIAKLKTADRHTAHVPLQSMCRSIIGTAQSCGIEVKRSISNEE